LGEHQNKADIPIINMQHNMEKKTFQLRLKYYMIHHTGPSGSALIVLLYQFNWIFFSLHHFALKVANILTTLSK